MIEVGMKGPDFRGVYEFENLESKKLIIIRIMV